MTFSLVTIAGFFATQKPAVLMVACFSALLFWYIEASWKTFQYAYYDRAWEIEEYFRGKKKLDCALQISLSWNKSFQSGGIARLAWIMFWPHMALPHAAVAALSLALFLVIKFRCFML